MFNSKCNAYKVGPTGPQGIQGVKGDSGDTGPTGPQGSTPDLSDKGFIHKGYISASSYNADTATDGYLGWFNLYEGNLGTLPSKNTHALFLNQFGTNQLFVDSGLISFRHRDTTSSSWGSWYNLVDTSTYERAIAKINISTIIDNSNWYGNAFTIGKVCVCNIAGGVSKEIAAFSDSVDLFSISGVTSKIRTFSTVVNQKTGESYIINIATGGNVVSLLPKGVGIVSGEWIWGQIVFITN